MHPKVQAYISKKTQAHQVLLSKLRSIILNNFPDIQEEFKWGVPVYDDGKFYLASLTKQVNMGFAISGLSKEEINQFEGSGKTMRHIKIHSLESIDENHIIQLMKLVRKKSHCDECQRKTIT